MIKDLIVPPTGGGNDIKALRAAPAAAKMFEARIDAVPAHSGFATIAAKMIAGSEIFGGIMRRVLSGALRWLHSSCTRSVSWHSTEKSKMLVRTIVLPRRYIVVGMIGRNCRDER